MSSHHTRRNFLKLSGLTLAAVSTVASEAKNPSPRQSSGPAPGDLDIWVTDDDQRLAHASPLRWRAAAGSPAPESITLNPEKKFQPILGFGGAFTDATCYILHQLPAAGRATLLHQLFDPSELGLSVCRTCIGSSDYATKVYSYDEGEPDPELTRFSIDHDREYILPTLREARKVNPDLFLFSSPWSPPGWMKANNSMLGGSMRRKYMASYAQYFVKFLQAYEAEGVPVQAVTVQNEVDTDQDGRMPACIWPQEYEADFVRNFLGPAFEQAGLKTKIWIIDHNYNLWGRAVGELEVPGVRKFTNAIAWHGYVGEPGWMNRVQELYPDLEMYWTEGGPDYTNPKYATNWAEWGKTFSEILRHGCRSITGWNLVLDERGRPNIGPFTCGGTVTINSQSKALSYSGQYWASAHYSRFIRRGARRFESISQNEEMMHVGCENPDGQRVLVLANPNAERTAELRWSNWTASVPLKANSLTTVTWR
jgi:glucosylceramidase